jgi:hypothetical protein
MKVLSRDFSTKEKVMLVVLCLVLLALGYYRFIYVPTQDAIYAANSQQQVYETELLQVMTKEKMIRSMKDELDSIGELQEVSRMESYNNSKEEISLLNEALKPATEYSIAFTNVTRDGDQIRRNFSLSFKTDSFASAKRIIKSLEDSKYRCILGDIDYSYTQRRANKDEAHRGGHWVDDVYYFDVVAVNTSATFFETMYGGTPDAGLPAA